MITPPVNKPSQRQNKCIIVWLMILSVLLTAMLAGLVFIGLKIHKVCAMYACMVSVILHDKYRQTAVVMLVLRQL